MDRNLLQNLRRTKQAQRDIEKIWDYSVREWGEAQAEQYVGELVWQGLRALNGELPLKQLDSMSGRLRYCRVQHHYLIIAQEEEPFIAAVLHERMDIPAQVRRRLS